MGMFDYVKCDYSEMSEEDRKRDYQTKSLYSALENYLIKEDGSLWVETYEEELVDNPTFDLSKEEDIFNQKQIFARKNVQWLPRPITDTIIFYDYDDETNDRIEYKAQYTEGKLTYFKRVDDE